MTIEIKNRYTNQTIYTGEGESLSAVVQKAVVTGANLTRADLAGANLTGANLAGADLTYAYMTRANLAGANLTDADLAGANLTYAYMTGANLTGANLTGADLDTIKADFFDVLDRAPNEVAGLLATLEDGKVDGSTYEGECACLVGTIANVRQCNYLKVEGIFPNSERPAERWFLSIRKGDTPKNSQVAEITKRWIGEWMAKSSGVSK